MVIVLFEVLLNTGMKNAYLAMAEMLSEELGTQRGFISLERYDSVKDENRMISIQYWQDEAAVDSWRENAKHRRMMPAGFENIFSDYRLTVLTPIRAYGKYDRAEAPLTIEQIKNKH